MKYEIEKLNNENWDTFEFPMQQLLVRLGLWKYVKQTGQWPLKTEDEYDTWEMGCEKACAELALRVGPEVMHIV